MIGQRQVEIMTVFSPKVRSLKAKILQVQILSKFKFSKKFFWDISKILFAIGNGIKRGFQINKNFPCRLRTLKIIDIFPNFWAAHTEAELNLENILSGYGGCFSRFLFGVQGLKGGSIGFWKRDKLNLTQRADIVFSHTTFTKTHIWWWFLALHKITEVWNYDSTCI
mgnify:CR=1 FL=1